jgi:hypothetical protein
MTSSLVNPTSFRAKTSKKSSTTPSSTATVLPFKSATLLIDLSAIIWSFPAELSLTKTTT